MRVCFGSYRDRMAYQVERGRKASKKIDDDDGGDECVYLFLTLSLSVRSLSFSSFARGDKDVVLLAAPPHSDPTSIRCLSLYVAHTSLDLA